MQYPGHFGQKICLKISALRIWTLMHHILIVLAILASTKSILKGPVFQAKLAKTFMPDWSEFPGQICSDFQAKLAQISRPNRPGFPGRIGLGIQGPTGPTFQARLAQISRPDLPDFRVRLAQISRPCWPGFPVQISLNFQARLA